MLFSRIPSKIYYPEDGYTKGDLLAYYDAVAPLMLPHLKDRPLSLKRYPNGIHAEFFFQKNTPENYPSWLRTETIDKTRFILAEDKASLLYLTNLGCIDQNPWMSRVGSLDFPDYILIDLDPYQCEFDKVVEAALLVKEKLDAIGLKGYPKTTGGDGMHIFIPIEPVYTYEQARSFAEVIARLLDRRKAGLVHDAAISRRARERPGLFRLPADRGEQNDLGAVCGARLSGRAGFDAARWDEVTPELHPSQFNIKNAPARFARTGDLFAPVLTKPQRLEKAFAKLEKMVKRRTPPLMMVSIPLSVLTSRNPLSSSPSVTPRISLSTITDFPRT